ncbi:MAG: hypothetical protein KBT47_08795, partial [Armatimonadetes bacterium]|nr:hypothetical protein [Candidatus Hippobium faecium]
LLDKKLGENFRITHYDADVIETFAIPNMFPGFSGEFIEDEKTVWMTKGAINDYSEVLDCPLPDPDSEDIYRNIIETREKYPDKAIFAMIIPPIGTLGGLKLPQDFMMDLASEPELIHSVIKRIMPVLTKVAENACNTDIDVLYIADDICMSGGLIYSEKMLREFQFDYIKSIIDMAHSKGKKVFYHTDGMVMNALNLFAEYGIDGINPLEPRFNSGKEFISRTKGSLMLYGGIDNCHIIPEGTEEDIVMHIKSQFENIGKHTPMIFSSHDIPSTVPLKNIDIMTETIKSLRY